MQAPLGRDRRLSATGFASGQVTEAAQVGSKYLEHVRGTAGKRVGHQRESRKPPFFVIRSF